MFTAIERNCSRIALVLVVAGAIVVPLLVSRSVTESFRLPKELFLRAEAVLLVATFVAALVAGASLRHLMPTPRVIALVALILASAAVTTLASTMIALSAPVLLTVAVSTIVFAGTASAARDRSMLLATAAILPAAVNAAIVILQETDIWMPFGRAAGLPHHVQCTALIGNPNEVGSYLAVSALACIVLVPAVRGWQRGTLVAVAALLIAGLAASRTLTAAAALGASLLVLSAMASWRKAAATMAILIAVAAIAVVALPPLRERAMFMKRAFVTRDYNALSTDRVAPMVAAWAMFRDHPVTGVGPGAFAWHYYDYKLVAEERLPALRGAWNRGTNYGEAHNDHLQVLAESGLLGYTVLLGALGALASRSFVGPRASSEVASVARRLACPLAVCCAVLGLAQFPLESTVVRSVIVHFAALVFAWSEG